MINLPFVIQAGLWVKIACFAIEDHVFTYHLIYKMVSAVQTFMKQYKRDRDEVTYSLDNSILGLKK